MKLKKIDLQYCRYPEAIPSNFIDIPKHILTRLDNSSLQSLNGKIPRIFFCLINKGARDADFILSCISNLEKFQVLLKFVKIWAKSK